MHFITRTHYTTLIIIDCPDNNREQSTHILILYSEVEEVNFSIHAYIYS